MGQQRDDTSGRRRSQPKAKARQTGSLTESETLRGPIIPAPHKQNCTPLRYRRGDSHNVALGPRSQIDACSYAGP